MRPGRTSVAGRGGAKKGGCREGVAACDGVRPTDSRRNLAHLFFDV